MSHWFVGVNAIAESWLTILLRACWQGGLFIFVIWVICRALPKLSARVQCWLWRLAYLKLLLAFFWSGSIDLPLLPANLGSGGKHRAIMEIAAAPLEKSEALRSLPQRSTLPSLAALLLLVWAFGAVRCAVLMEKNWSNTCRLRRKCIPLSHDELNKWFLVLCQRLRLRRSPRLFVNENNSGPLLLGLLRPMIILPSHLVSSGSLGDLRMMIAHELAHHKRLDLWWAWLPTLGELLFFFHPLVWLAKRQWRACQEMACDELAVRATDASLTHYGEMLLRLAASYHRCSPQPKTAFVLNVIETKQTLERRLKAMQFIKQNSRKRPLLAASFLLLVAAAGILPWRVVAQSPPTGIRSSENGKLEIIKGERFVLQPIAGPVTNLLRIVSSTNTPRLVELRLNGKRDKRFANLRVATLQAPSKLIIEQKLRFLPAEFQHERTIPLFYLERKSNGPPAGWISK